METSYWLSPSGNYMYQLCGSKSILYGKVTSTWTNGPRFKEELKLANWVELSEDLFNFQLLKLKLQHTR